MRPYERKEIYSLDTIFKHVHSSKECRNNPELRFHEFDGDIICMSSLRYRTFKFVSHKCSKCGLEGTFFAKERTKGQTGRYHFNLYGYREDGTEMMLTKDHVRPRAEGGTDNLMNMDCMCKRCNEKKGDTWNGTSGC